jgi:hypothetical protein
MEEEEEDGGVEDDDDYDEGDALFEGLQKMGVQKMEIDALDKQKEPGKTKQCNWAAVSGVMLMILFIGGTEVVFSVL